MNSPERSPAKPARFPATERSWHGEPPAMMSTGGRSVPFSWVMSPICRMAGNRAVVTRMGNASISLAQTGSIPF